MKNEINAVLENMTDTTPEPEDYTGDAAFLFSGTRPSQVNRPRRWSTPTRGGLT